MKIFIEGAAGDRFECDIPLNMELSVLAADFFDARKWPTTDNQGRGQQAVVELVDPENPGNTKRLSGDINIEKAGIGEGTILRILPESIIDENRPFEQEWENAFIQKLIHNHSQVTTFEYSSSIFKRKNFDIEPDLCLILMPFGVENLNIIYTDHVKPVLQKFGLRVKRGDDIHSTQHVMEDLWENINRARFIIAELTGRNANVFYEIGICHTIGKEVILLVQSVDDVPFDLRGIRMIEYTYTPRGCDKLEEKLTHTVKKLFN